MSTLGYGCLVRTTAALVLLTGLLAGCGGGHASIDEVQASVSRDLQARVNARLTAAPRSAQRVVTFGEVRCPKNARTQPGALLSCRAFASHYDGSDRLTYIVSVRVLDAHGRVRYTIRRPRAGES